MVPELDAHLERMTARIDSEINPSTRGISGSIRLGWAHAGFAPSGKSDRPACERSMCRGPNLLRDPASRRGGSVLHVNDERIRACHLAEQSTAGTPRP